MANGKPGRPAAYTPEYKRNAVDYYLSTGKTQREVAGELGIPQRTLGKWVQALAPDSAERQLADELRSLRAEVARLEKENEFLKKAAAFFAAGSR